MNSWIFGISMFMVMLNFSTLVMPLFIPGMNDPITGFSIQAYDENLTNRYTDFTKSTANTGSQATDSQFSIWRVLDLINVGFIKQFYDLITGVLWGFPNMMKHYFSFGMTDAQRDVIFTGMNTIFTIAFGVFVFGLWTGRNVMGNDNK